MNSCSQLEQKKSNSEESLSKLGRYLFFDTRLSFNQTKSCASCHDPKFAFTDGYRKSITASGDRVIHNAPSLINVSLQYYFDWANDTITSLYKQSERPLFNRTPVELGAKGNETEILNRLKKDKFYQEQFHLIFNDEDPFSFKNIRIAINAFTTTLISFNSPYDKYIKGDSAALTISSKKGMKLFFSDALHCAACHKPPYFSKAAITKNIDSIYFNTGLYNVKGKDQYPCDDAGLFMITKNEKDNGKFKTPTLRNVAITAPYTHDGSVNSLSEMIDIYSNGGRIIHEGPNAGNGIKNKNKNNLIQGFEITSEEKKQLIDFLYSLSDSSIFTNPAFQNPFTQK